MANGRGRNQGRQNNSGEQELSRAVDVLFGGGFSDQSTSVPQTNRALSSASTRNDERIRGGYGLVANTIESGPNKLRVIMPEHEAPVKTDEKLPGNLETKQNLRGQSIVLGSEGNLKRAEGRFAVETWPILVIGHKIYGFRGSGGRIEQEHDPLQGMPSLEMGRDFVDHYFIVGTHKTTGQTVIIAPEDPIVPDGYITREVKQRVIASLNDQLERATASHTSDTSLTELTDKIKMLTKANTVHRVSFDNLAEKNTTLGTVTEMVLAGDQDKVEQVSGLVRFDAEANVLTVAEPLRLDLADYDVKIFDGTGRNRQIIELDKPLDNQPSEIRDTLAFITRGDQLIQKNPGGEVTIPNQLQGTLLREPRAVPQLHD